MRHAVAVVASMTLSMTQAADAQRNKKLVRPAATALPAAPVAEPAACTSLRSDYANVSKQLALRQSDEALDDSAPRATMRETQNNSSMTQASMTLELMKSNGCKLPGYAPSASAFGMAALKCTTAKQEIRTKRALDRLTNTFVEYADPSECDTENWQPNK